MNTTFTSRFSPIANNVVANETNNNFTASINSGSWSGYVVASNFTSPHHTITQISGSSFFPFYDNFAGTALNSSRWGVMLSNLSSTFSVDNGLTVGSPSNYGKGAVYTQHAVDSSLIYEGYRTSVGGAYNTGGYNFVNPIYPGSPNDFFGLTTNRTQIEQNGYWMYRFIFPLDGAPFMLLNSYNVFAALGAYGGTGTAIVSILWSGQGDECGGVTDVSVNGGIACTTDNSVAFGPLYLTFGASSTTSIQHYYWVRGRPMNPLPSTQFGPLVNVAQN